MSIPTVTEAAFRTPAPTVSSGASTGVGAAAVQQEAAAKSIASVPEPDAPPASPPPPPVVGFQQDVLVGIDEATNRKVYDIVEPDTGDQIVQIPAEAVLNLVAKILQQLEAEGLR